MTHLETLRFDYERIRKDLKFFPHIVAKINFNISCVLGERLADMMNSFLKDKEEHELATTDYREDI